MAELMARVAPPVCVSARRDQSRHPGFSGLDIMCDEVEGIGPLAGLLAAFARDPAAAWLVTAVDMPWITAATLRRLVDARDPAMRATAYRNPWTGTPEPMCAIYEPAILPVLLRAREARRYSLMLLRDVPGSSRRAGGQTRDQGYQQSGGISRLVGTGGHGSPLSPTEAGRRPAAVPAMSCLMRKRPGLACRRPAAAGPPGHARSPRCGRPRKRS